VLDTPLDRVLLLEPAGAGKLRTSFVATGKNIVSAAASADGRHLFVLSRGQTPRRQPSDAPALTIIDGSPGNVHDDHFEMPVARDGLAIDPLGEWVAVYSSGASTGEALENPNEIVLVGLAGQLGDKNPIARTLRSFGGRPTRLEFLPPLLVGKEVRRLLV